MEVLERMDSRVVASFNMHGTENWLKHSQNQDLMHLREMIVTVTLNQVDLAQSSCFLCMTNTTINLPKVEDGKVFCWGQNKYGQEYSPSEVLSCIKVKVNFKCSK